MSDCAKTTMPALVYEPARCPHCGAITTTDAETMCRPINDECQSGGDEDAAGNLTQPTAASVAALDAWIERRAMREVAEDMADV
jgi:hypothetical protein